MLCGSPSSRLKGKEAIEISKRMTNGFKGDLFSMYFSFIGWYILVGLTGGILSIYVTPYVETTAAMYYENLKRYSIENGIVAPEAFGIAYRVTVHRAEPPKILQVRLMRTDAEP